MNELYHKKLLKRILASFSTYGLGQTVRAFRRLAIHLRYRCLCNEGKEAQRLLERHTVKPV